MSALANLQLENRAVKTECARQVGLKKHEEKVAEHAVRCTVDTWKVMYAAGLTEQLQVLIWKYVVSAPYTIFKQCDSKIFGVKTVIKPYTTKKGETFLAHFTVYNHYYGKVSKLGEEPIFYTGNFPVSSDRFTLDMTRLPSMQTFNDVYNLSELFVPTAKIVDEVFADTPPKNVFQTIQQRVRTIDPRYKSNLQEFAAMSALDITDDIAANTELS